MCNSPGILGNKMHIFNLARELNWLKRAVHMLMYIRIIHNASKKLLHRMSVADSTWLVVICMISIMTDDDRHWTPVIENKCTQLHWAMQVVHVFALRAVDERLIVSEMSIRILTQIRENNSFLHFQQDMTIKLKPSLIYGFFSVIYSSCYFTFTLHVGIVIRSHTTHMHLLLMITHVILSKLKSQVRQPV